MSLAWQKILSLLNSLESGAKGIADKQLAALPLSFLLLT